MHIAVCDDNAGDRRQLERLLKRESDRRAPVCGVFYTDSYGSADAVMKSPMLYDVFFIDMTAGDTDGAALSRRLLKAGVTSPIVLCISLIDYRAAFPVPSCAEVSKTASLDASPKAFHNLLFIDKPIRQAELTALLDRIIENRSQTVPTIELRGEKATRYVTEDDIVYAKAQDMYVTVYLKDGTVLPVISTLDNFYAQLASFTHYAAVSRNSMVNVTCLNKVSLTRLTLTDGTVLRTSPSYAPDIKKALRQFTEGL